MPGMECFPVTTSCEYAVSLQGLWKVHPGQCPQRLHISDKIRWHFSSNTLTDSTNKTSGGKAPVDSIETVKRKNFSSAFGTMREKECEKQRFVRKTLVKLGDYS
jgi:hypothetical protein